MLFLLIFPSHPLLTLGIHLPLSFSLNQEKLHIDMHACILEF